MFLSCRLRCLSHHQVCQYGQNTFISMCLQKKHGLARVSLALKLPLVSPNSFPGGRHLTKNDIIASEKNMFRTHGWNAGYFVWRFIYHFSVERTCKTCANVVSPKEMLSRPAASTRVSELATFSCHESFRRCARTGSALRLRHPVRRTRDCEVQRYSRTALATSHKHWRSNLAHTILKQEDPAPKQPKERAAVDVHQN